MPTRGAEIWGGADSFDADGKHSAIAYLRHMLKVRMPGALAAVERAPSIAKLLPSAATFSNAFQGSCAWCCQVNRHHGGCCLA